MLQRSFSSKATNVAATSAVRSTAASGSMVYESKRASHEYLQFHYGKPTDVMPYDFGPQDALKFLSVTAKDSASFVTSKAPRRALDVGCAVGGASFELAKYFDEVVGIDFSQAFVDVANEMKSKGEMEYSSLQEGTLESPKLAQVGNDVDRTRCHFEQGDACSLSESLGTFDLVFASNLLCRLPQPSAFLDRLPSLVNQNGVLALISPYSWLTEYTAKEEWIGGTETHPDSFAEIHRHLEQHFELVHRKDYAFIIREHRRKFQYGVSDGTFWRRK